MRGAVDVELDGAVDGAAVDAVDGGTVVDVTPDDDSPDDDPAPGLSAEVPELDPEPVTSESVPPEPEVVSVDEVASLEEASAAASESPVHAPSNNAPTSRSLLNLHLSLP